MEEKKDGAAVATMLSNLAALVYFSVLFYRHREEWSVSFRMIDALPGKRTAIQVLLIGLPSALVTTTVCVLFPVIGFVSGCK